MSLFPMLRLLAKSRIRLILALVKTGKEFFRACFLSSALEGGMYDVMSSGPVTLEDFESIVGLGGNRDGLKAWLDFGVSLGELKRNGDRYSINGLLSKELVDPANDTWRAFLVARVEIFRDYILRTPQLLRENKKLVLDESYGELFARSSRTVEPLLLDVTDRVIPRSGLVKLLEVGCGTGLYIERACKVNPDLRAVGLELQTSVADFARENIQAWGLADRVDIQAADIRAYSPGEASFDLVTFHNLIYYFPMEERVDILRHIRGLLNPGGRLITTTLCLANDPSIAAMNLWTAMTEGCGPLPDPDEYTRQIEEAGFGGVNQRKLMPGYWLFTAEKGDSP